MRSRIVVSVTALALLLAACSSGSSPSPSAVASAAGAAPANLTIYGAASLKAVLAKAQTAYQAANPGTTITISTDSSSALETKIEQGAPADVFLSADTDWMDYLQARSLIQVGTRRNLLGHDEPRPPTRRVPR